MSYYIAETDRGLTVEQCPPGSTVDECAALRGETVIDPGPYDDYEAAIDALGSLQSDMEREHSDTPGTRVVEGRPGPAD